MNKESKCEQVHVDPIILSNVSSALSELLSSAGYSNPDGSELSCGLECKISNVADVTGITADILTDIAALKAKVDVITVHNTEVDKVISKDHDIQGTLVGRVTNLETWKLEHTTKFDTWKKDVVVPKFVKVDKLWNVATMGLPTLIAVGIIVTILTNLHVLFPTGTKVAPPAVKVTAETMIIKPKATCITNYVNVRRVITGSETNLVYEN